MAGRHAWQEACIVGGRGHAWQGDVHSRRDAWQGACMVGGACMAGVHVVVVGGGACMVAGEMATEAGGTHITGMHSCSSC